MSSRWLPAMQAGVLDIVTIGQVWSPPSESLPNGGYLATFNVTTGSVVIDCTNAIRRTLQNATLVPFPMDPLGSVTVPDAATDDLFPSGNELVIRKGVLYSDGTSETAQLGRFLMEDVEIYNDSSSGNLYVELNGRDRGGTIDRAGFAVPYATDGTSTLDVQLAALINFAVPNLPLSITPSTFVPAQMTFAIGSSPWTAALALAAAGGYEIFPDAFGIITARPVVNPQTTAISVVYDASEGNTTGVVSEVQRSLVTTGIPNVVIMQAQGSNIPTPFISYWWDSNPASKTFYNSTVPTPGSNMSTLPSREGTYPYTSSSQTNAAATTQEQNDTIALAQGTAVLGTFETVTFYIRDNAAHDVEDVVTLIEPESLITTKDYMINTLTLQLDHSTAMEVQAQLVVAG